MREKLLRILKEIREDVDYENVMDLISNKKLKSFDIISIIARIEEDFKVEIEPDEMTTENFDNIDAILDLLEEKMRDSSVSVN